MSDFENQQTEKIQIPEFCILSNELENIIFLLKKCKPEYSKIVYYGCDYFSISFSAWNQIIGSKVFLRVKVKPREINRSKIRYTSSIISLKPNVQAFNKDNIPHFQKSILQVDQLEGKKYYSNIKIFRLLQLDFNKYEKILLSFYENKIFDIDQPIYNYHVAQSLLFQDSVQFYSDEDKSSTYQDKLFKCKNAKSVTIDIGWESNTPFGLRVILNLLKQFQNINSYNFKLQNHKLSDESQQELIKFLENQNHIKSISFSIRCKVSQSDCKEINAINVQRVSNILPKLTNMTSFQLQLYDKCMERQFEWSKLSLMQNLRKLTLNLPNLFQNVEQQIPIYKSIEQCKQMKQIILDLEPLISKLFFVQALIGVFQNCIELEQVVIRVPPQYQFSYFILYKQITKLKYLNTISLLGANNTHLKPLNIVRKSLRLVCYTLQI